jgi:hypothetical protein
MVVETTANPSVVAVNPQKAYQKKKTIFRIYQLIWYALGFIEVLLAFRFFLKLIGANPFTGFVSLIYGLSEPFILPFSGIVQTTVANTSIFEWSAIIAAIVYVIVAYGLVQLFQLIKPTNPEEVAENVDSQ